MVSHGRLPPSLVPQVSQFVTAALSVFPVMQALQKGRRDQVFEPGSFGAANIIRMKK